MSIFFYHRHGWIILDIQWTYNEHERTFNNNDKYINKLINSTGM